MPVQTRQSTQAASHPRRLQYDGKCLPASACTLTTAALASGRTSQAQAPQQASTANTPQTAGRSVRRRICEASPSDEQMVADMQAYEQQMAEGYQECLGCTVNITDTGAVAKLNQRNLTSLQHEAEELQTAEAQIQQDLEVAAEAAALESHSECLHAAADFILTPNQSPFLAADNIQKTVQAAKHLLSICEKAQNFRQQAELQTLRQEIQQLQMRSAEDKNQCAALQATNGCAKCESLWDYAVQQTDMMTKFVNDCRALDQARIELLIRIELENEKHRCCICMAAQKDVMLFPCMHTDFCMGCIGKHMQFGKDCPICRMPIRGVLPTRLAQ